MEESDTEEFKYFEDEPVFEVEISSTNDNPFDVEDYEQDFKGTVHQESEDYEQNIKETIRQECDKDYEPNIKGTSSKKFYKCEYCAADFPSMSKLGVHVGLDHPDHLQDVETFECQLCNKTFYDSQLLARHLRRVHDDSIKNSTLSYPQKRYIPGNCETCGKYLRSRRVFEDHEEEHRTGLKKYLCEICNKRFRDFLVFKKHKKKHENEPQSKLCPICGQVFESNGDLKKHKKSKHRDTFKTTQHKCELCEESFLEKGKLIYHRYKAHGVNARICDFCGIQCSLSGRLLHKVSCVC